MKHLDRLPMGFSREKKGWLITDATPQAATIARLQKQNKELGSRLAQLEELVLGLTTKKRKK